MQLTIDDILHCFGGETAVNHPLIPNARCAAVALIFAEQNGELCLCFEKRAEFEGDPWSGDMSFPGGKADPPDATFHDTASRETWEEVGVTLLENELVGALPLMKLGDGRKRPFLHLQPLIYIKQTPPEPFHINGELEAAYWIPLSHLWQHNNWIDNHVQWNNQTYPGIQFGNHVIWGLTLRILTTFAEKMAHPFPLWK